MSVPGMVRSAEEAEPLWKTPPERRSVTRFRMGLSRPCEVLCGEPPALAEARMADLSACGVGLVLTGPLLPGAVVAIHLGPGPFLSSRAVAARVAYCVPLDEGGYLVGAEFARRLAADELRLLVS
jgi:PilZ domain